jgi:FkbM family methyltransferase
MSAHLETFGSFAPSKWQARIIAFARSFDPGPLSKTAASIAKRLLWPGLHGPLDVATWGIAMRLDPRRNVTEKRLMFSPSRFELEERIALQETLKPGDTFVDVGANVGAYSVWSARLVGNAGRVISIEPQPSVLGRLRDNVALNPDFSVTVFPCGAGPAEATMFLSIGSTNEGGASLATKGGGSHTVEVPVRPLLSILQEAGIIEVRALKIDIEGFEDQALVPFFDSAPKSLRPKMMILERSEKDWSLDLLGRLKLEGYVTRFETKRNYVLDLKATT